VIPFRDVKRKLAVGFIKSFDHLLEPALRTAATVSRARGLSPLTNTGGFSNLPLWSGLVR